MAYGGSQATHTYGSRIAHRGARARDFGGRVGPLVKATLHLLRVEEVEGVGDKAE